MKEKNNKYSVISFIVVAIISGVLSGYVVSYLLSGSDSTKSEEDLIKEFYSIETAVHVSPHHIRKGMAKGDDSFILVDLRSQEEYEREHIVGAINIPAYKDPNTSDYGDIERIVSEFSKLSKDKDIIVYCYSIPCMTGRKVGKILADNDIYVKHLGIGWNEWRYYWDLWNHEHEWKQTDVSDYVSTGSEPGSVNIIIDSSSCSIEGELGC
jgi:rhodanese-related sulfurtransferase